MPQSPPLAYVREGQTPFFRLPSTAFDDQGVRRYERAPDAVLVGAPWDGGTTFNPGARLGPWAVRRASAHVQGYHPIHEIDVFGSLEAVDGGNVPITPFDPAFARAAIEGDVSSIVEAGAVPVLVGGDHSVAYPAIRAVARKHGPLAIVHLDAHLDTSGDAIWGDAYHHGTPIRHVLSEGLVAPGALHQVGIRASWGSPEEGAFAASHGAHRWDVDTIAERGIGTIARAIRAAIGDRPTYLTLDVDGIDPAYAPGTGTPVPGGLATREVLRLLRGLSGIQVVGIDVVEVCPARDVADATATVAAHLLFEGLALVAIDRRRRAKASRSVP
jgi:agmatinase